LEGDLGASDLASRHDPDIFFSASGGVIFDDTFNALWTLWNYFLGYSSKVRHRVAAMRAAADIDFSAKFMGLRHDGNTEGGNADLTDTQLRALSGHKTAAMTALYTKATVRQRRSAARKRLEARMKGGNLSK
jgi:hypothetical protein